MRFLLKTLHPVLSASFALLGTLTIAQTPAETVQFKDITQQARINFQHHNGAAGKIHAGDVGTWLRIYRLQ